ncbi:ABC transporter ATP-binding protein [Streptococcus sp. E17BB]|uniref:ABC transporter ATP-binding protein n=1 Tax=Streptococcus sp. E17BB TaxID=3278714 RepID=UPI00359CCFAD
MKTIEIKEMSFSFGRQDIFKQLNGSFASGEIVGITGKNGSGKSVLFKIIAGLAKPKEGEVWVNGREVATSTRFADKIGVLIEEPSFLPELTAYDNLALLLSINQNVSKEVIEGALEAVDLLAFKDKKVKHFSLGMKKKMGIAQAIMEHPKVLLLDEPMNALDADAVMKIRELILRLAKQGTTVLMASHNQEDIDCLCHKVYKVEDYKLVEQS